MAKNRFTCSYPNQQTPAMSPSHTYTVGAVENIIFADDEDDNDICPVCDGECTCDNRPGSSTTNGNAHHVPSTPISSSPIPHMPSLKIRLTVPPNMLANRHSALSSVPKKPLNVGDVSGLGGETHQDPPKRRGRPPKALRASKTSVDQYYPTTPTLGPSQSYSNSHAPRIHPRKDRLPSTIRKRKPIATLLPAKPRDKGTTARKAAVPIKKRRAALSGSSGSDLTDLDDQHEDNDDDGAQFPTFVSASVMSTSTASSSSDSGSLSGFDTDSSIEAEEENYILTEERRAHNKAHVRRELLGDEGQKRKDPHNNWVIRPRKKSVGPSDVEMDGDSDDATEDDEEDDEEEEGEADEEDADDRVPGVGYAGVATGWSEDEESSFDADLFFANLSDSTDSTGSSSADDGDGDQSDFEAMSLAEFLPMTREQIDTLPFEVTESWDGQIVFSNGLREGQGILDIDFEVNAAQLVDSSASPSQTSEDVDMQASDGEDNEYEADGDINLEESDGETTEEELVDDNGLPTERAMKLFRLPSSISAINPLSTVSPCVSPSPRNGKRHHDSPKPADILAGKLFYEDSDEYDHDTAAPVGNTRGARSIASSSSRGLPAMGSFDPGDANPSKRAIINGSTKDVPSPFPRRRTRNPGSRLGSFSGMEHSRSSSLPLMSPDEVAATSPEAPPAAPIDLDDVLEASFMDSDPQTPPPSVAEGGSRKHLQNLSRWDLISVGAFRQTRETASINDTGSTGWSEPASTSDAFAYGSMIKTSPLSTMLWHHKDRHPSQQTQTAGRSRADKRVVISPVILPVRDGDRTPTNGAPNRIPHIPRIPHNGKTRKEQRKDKKMKRKSFPPVPYQHIRHQYHQHQHHPNSKSRSSSAMQRSNGFSPSMSSVPPLNL